jgi:hypothetical protein
MNGDENGFPVSAIRVHPVDPRAISVGADAIPSAHLQHKKNPSDTFREADYVYNPAPRQASRKFVLRRGIHARDSST